MQIASGYVATRHLSVVLLSDAVYMNAKVYKKRLRKTRNVSNFPSPGFLERRTTVHEYK